MNVWIDTKYCLPEDNQEVVFKVKDRFFSFGGIYRNGHFEEALDNWNFEGEEITYWMPIPPLSQKQIVIPSPHIMYG